MGGPRIVGGLGCTSTGLFCPELMLGTSITERWGDAVGLDPLELFAVSVGVFDVVCTGEDVNPREGAGGGDPRSSRKKTSSLF